METIACYLKTPIELEDLEIIAQAKGYRAYITDFQFKQLVIEFGEDRLDHWYCSKIYKENGQWDDLWYDDENDYVKLEALAPAAIFFILYYPSSLAELAIFFTAILEQYDGFVECKGGLMDALALENINDIVFRCQ